MGLSSGAYSLFDAVNLPHVGARMIWIRLLILGAVIVPVAFWTQNVIDIAICRALGEALFLPGLFHAVHRVANIAFKQYVETLYRPLSSSAAMAVAVLAANTLLPLSGNYRLLTDIGLGAAVFLGSTWILWQTAGRPPAPEANVFSAIAKVFRRSPTAAGN